MASIFQIGISQNTKCALKDGFRKSSHIYTSPLLLSCFTPMKPWSVVVSSEGPAMYGMPESSVISQPFAQLDATKLVPLLLLAFSLLIE